MASQGQVCNSSALKTFPNKLLFGVNSELYSSKSPQPLNITFSWGTRSSPPGFDDTGTGVLLPEPNVVGNTFRYLNYTYTLSKVQFTPPLHNSWVVPNSRQTVNKEDIVLTYTNSEKINDIPRVIIINIPIIRSDVTTYDPAYLVALSNPNTPTTSLSIKNIFPNRKNDIYLYYHICAQGYNAGDVPQDIISIVYVNGLYVSNTLMNNIMRQFNQVSGTFAAYQPPITLNFSSSSINAFDNKMFDTYVKHGFNLIDHVEISTGVQIQPDMNAYKCVPLNPDKDVSGGQLNIDPETGILYSEIDAERKRLINEATSPRPNFISQEKFVESVSQYMSIIIVVIIFGILFFMIFSNTSTGGAPGEHSSFLVRMLQKLSAVPLILIIGVVAGFIGYLVGMTTG